jgi:hypothetical protein
MNGFLPKEIDFFYLLVEYLCYDYSSIASETDLYNDAVSTTARALAKHCTRQARPDLGAIMPDTRFLKVYEINAKTNQLDFEVAQRRAKLFGTRRCQCVTRFTSNVTTMQKFEKCNPTS